MPVPQRWYKMSESPRSPQKRCWRPITLSLLVGPLVLLLGNLAACGETATVSSSLGGTSQTTPTASGGMVVSASGIVTATKGGFINTTMSTYTDINYGLVLGNQSSQLAAIGVEVTVTFTDGHGHTSLPDATTLTGIPAHGTFYFSGSSSTLSFSSSSPSTWTPQQMKVEIGVQRTSSANLILPTVSGLSIAGSLLPKLTGTFNNPYAGQAGEEWDGDSGVLYVLYYDERGQFVGDDELDLDSLGVLVTPGGTGQFSLTNPPPSAATSTKASIDPCGGLGGAGLSTTCVALQ